MEGRSKSACDTGKCILTVDGFRCCPSGRGCDGSFL